MSKGPRAGHDDDTAWPPRIQRLVEERRLRAQSYSRVEVLALWQKAVATARDASLSELSVDSAIRLAYDAGHAAALALLAAHGLRVGSGAGHHELAFYCAAAFDDPGLEDLVADSAEVRQTRHGSMYDPVIAGATQRLGAIAWMRRTLPAIRIALVTLDPALEGGLALLSFE